MLGAGGLKRLLCSVFTLRCTRKPAFCGIQCAKSILRLEAYAIEFLLKGLYDLTGFGVCCGDLFLFCLKFSDFRGVGIVNQR